MVAATCSIARGRKGNQAPRERRAMTVPMVQLVPRARRGTTVLMVQPVPRERLVLMGLTAHRERLVLMGPMAQLAHRARRATQVTLYPYARLWGLIQTVTLLMFTIAFRNRAKTGERASLG